MINRSLRLAFGAAFVAVCMLAGLSVQAQAIYRIKPLGLLGGCTAQAPIARDFNEKGQVTGQACNQFGQLRAFLWKNDGTAMIDLGPSGPGVSSIGHAINENGLVAGTVDTSTDRYGFVSNGAGSMTKILNTLGGGITDARDVNDFGVVTGRVDVDGLAHPYVWKSGSPMRDLGTVDDHWYLANGSHINNAGQVAGTASDGDRSSIAIIWNNDGSPLQPIPDLGGSRASPCCLNASGQVAGSASVQGYAHPHAFFWRNDGSPPVDLGSFAASSTAHSNALALNNAGQVVGWANTSWSGRPHAFVWLNNGTPIQDLGTFGGTRSVANDINAPGQVVGSANLSGDSAARAFRWSNDGSAKQMLGTLIDPRDPLRNYITLTAGLFINDQGNILAEGHDSRTGKVGLYYLQGTVITLTPRSLAFGKVAVGTVSAAKAVTVKNTGAKNVAITSVALTGTNARQFAFTHNCGQTLAGYASCTVRVVFKPASRGTKSAVLSVNGGGGGLRTTTLAGTGA